MLDGGEIHAELVLGLAGGNIFVSLGVHIRIHPHGGGSDHAEFSSDFIEIAEFFLALDVEGVNPLLEGIDNFLTSLADTGKSTVRGIATGLNYAEKFATGNDVETRTVGGEQTQHGKIGIRLHRISDFVVHPVHRVI